MCPQKTTSPYLVIRRSKIHGTGAFARTDISQGTRVIEYVGEKITKAEADRRAHVPLKRHKRNKEHGAVYIFELNQRHDVDGDVAWNTAKYINHSCEPNCETDIIRGRIWIIALRRIRRGEELSYNYGYDVDEYHEHPCNCGKRRCVKYIVAEEHWPKLSRRRKKKRAGRRRT